MTDRTAARLEAERTKLAAMAPMMKAKEVRFDMTRDAWGFPCVQGWFLIHDFNEFGLASVHMTGSEGGWAGQIRRSDWDKLERCAA